MNAATQSAAGAIFIVGCQRSGTTLVRQMCCGHPALDVMPETHLMPLLAGRGRVLAQLGRRGLAAWLQRTLPAVNGTWQRPEMASRLTAACRALAESPTRGAADAAGSTSVFAAWLAAWREVCQARPGEKTPSHVYYLPALLTAFPDAQAVVMHRDPRAAGCSEWLKHRSIAAPNRRFGWFRFAVRWASSVAVASDGERHFGADRVLQLRYEQLLAEPEATARRLSGFLGVPFDPGMLDVGQVNSSYRQGESADALQGVVSAPDDRWKEHLSRDTVRRLEHKVGPWMQRLGYPRCESAGRGGAASRAPLAGLVEFARRRPQSFNRLASRGRYAGLHPNPRNLAA